MAPEIAIYEVSCESGRWIEPRDHLGKSNSTYGPEVRRALTCPFRYDWVRFSTTRYRSFFPFLPKNCYGRSWRGIFWQRRERGSATGPATSQRAAEYCPADLCDQGRRQRLAGQPASRHRSGHLGRPQFRQRALQPLRPPVAGDPSRRKTRPGPSTRASCASISCLPSATTGSGVDPAEVRGWYHALAAKYKSTGDDAYRLLRAIMNTGRRRQTDRALPMHGQRGQGY